MNKILEADLLKSAIEIGEEIIDKAIIDSNGIHWKTVKSVTPMDDLETDVDETIATGVSGIVLFYIELYKATNSDIYLEYINKSASWLVNHCQKKPSTHGFYSGRMGVVFTLLKIAEITQQEYYHKKAVEIATQFKDISSVPIKSFNLYNGLAGSILGLLYLHAEIEETWILDSIYEGIEHLMKNVKSNGVGFYWDTHFAESRSISTKPLCSMPLGSSGIGLLFLYLSKYFDNKDYEYIGIQALMYEDQYYDKDLSNWPDFRIFVDQKSSKKLRKAYLKDDNSHFESKGYCASWMYGIVGHSYIRLLAHDVLKDKYLDGIVNAIENNLNANNIGNQLSNYTLATGNGGLGLLLSLLSLSQKNENYFEKALAIAKMGIDERAIKKFYQFGFIAEIEYEDDSFLMGNAGVGYFYLKLLNRDNNCVLFPGLNSTVNTNCDNKVRHFNINYAIDKIARAWYPNTFSVIDDKIVFKTSNLNLESLKDTLIAHIEQAVEGLQDVQANDAYNYDKIKLSIQEVIRGNYGHFRFCHITEVSKSRSLLESKSRDDLMWKTLTLNQYSYFLTSKQDWKNVSLNDNAREINTLYSLGEEFTLSEVQYAILSSFKTPQKVNKVYKIFIDKNVSNADDFDYLLHLYFDVIRFFMSKGVLTSIKRPLFSQRHSTSKVVFLKEVDLKS